MQIKDWLARRRRGAEERVRGYESKGLLPRRRRGAEEKRLGL